VNDTARRLVALGIVLAVALGGAYAWAWVDNADRISDFGNAITHIGFARGGQPPDDAGFRREVEALAATHAVEIDALTITKSERTGVDAAGGLANERLAPVGQVSMRLLEYDVAATVHAKKWLFTRTGQIAVRRSYRMEVQLDTTPGGGPAGVLPSGLQPSAPLPELDTVDRGAL
jgi:hypothetical protein